MLFEPSIHPNQRIGVICVDYLISEILRVSGGGFRKAENRRGIYSFFILVAMGECPQTYMIKARIAPRSGAPAMLHTFAPRLAAGASRAFALLCAHVWALGKCPQMLMRAWHLRPLSSLL